MSNIKRYIESIADQLACDTADCGTCLDCQTEKEMKEWQNESWSKKRLTAIIGNWEAK